MNLKEWQKSVGITDGESQRQYFRNNIAQNKLPVAVYGCLVCNEVSFTGVCPNRNREDHKLWYAKWNK
jgi:hypothetical protein